jgi:hypothetical protein
MDWPLRWISAVWLSLAPRVMMQMSQETTPARWLHIILLAVAFVGWLVFILACVGGPAWSPDGTQILFAYRDVENSRTSVALYDRNRETVRTIFSQPSDDEDEPAIHPRWQSDGKRALIGFFGGTPDGSDDNCVLVSIPIKSRLPLQMYNLGRTPGCVYIYPEIGQKVYFAGKDLRWVDLKTGKIDSEKFKVDGKDSPEEELVLSESSNDLCYQRTVKRPRKPGDQQPGDESGEEVGVLQPNDASLKASFTFWESDLTILGLDSNVNDLSPMAMAPNETTGAMIATTKGKDSDRILLTEDGKGIVRVLAPDLGGKLYNLGNLVWSSDGKMLFASALTEGEPKKASDYWLAEIPVDGGTVRMTKIARLQHEMEGDFMDVFRFSMDVAPSPDQRWIAATPAVLGKDELDAKDRALFLIDLRDPGRKMKRVPIPHEPAE